MGDPRSEISSPPAAPVSEADAAERPEADGPSEGPAATDADPSAPGADGREAARAAAPEGADAAEGSPPAEAAPDGSARRAAVGSLLAKLYPDRADRLDELMAGYAGREEELVAKLSAADAAALSAAAAEMAAADESLSTEESASDDDDDGDDDDSSSTSSSDDSESEDDARSSSSGRDDSSSSSSSDPSEVGGVKIDDIDLEKELTKEPEKMKGDAEDDRDADKDVQKAEDDSHEKKPNQHFTIDDDDDDDEEYDARESVLLKEDIQPPPLQDEGISPLHYEDAELGETASASTPLRSNGSRIGRDRATVRRMVAQKMRGRRPFDGRRRKTRADAVPAARDIPLHWDDEAAPVPRGTRGRTARVKRRRACYAAVSSVIFVVGIALMIYGIARQREYARTQKAAESDDYHDDYYYDDREGGDDSVPENGMESVQAPTGPPTPPPTEVPDDALLSLLKMAYKTVLHSIPPTTESLHVIDSIETDLLNRKAQARVPAAERSVEWRAYVSLFKRPDVIDELAGALVMNEDLILQLYALTCFFFNFDNAQEGEDVCSWQGVRCDDVFPETHTDVLFSSPENLRVVSLSLPGESLTGTWPVELIFLPHLGMIDLSNNFIGGPLPKYFSEDQLESLKVLSLHDNRFEGTIPVEMAKLKHLEKLTLQHNELVGEVTNEICDLRDKYLHFLWVDCSSMPTTGLPKVPCPADCCTICFEGYDHDGGPSTGGSSPSGQVDTPHIVIGDWGKDVKEKLATLSVDGGMALLDINSPQFHAYGWLVEDSDGKGYDDERLFQRYALATLYFATNGAQWANRDGWISGDDECSWFGVSGCGDADNEAVVSIELFGNNLAGTLPPEFFVFFTDLMVLNLSDNHLTGSIPSSVGSLKSLSILELAENELTSHIPSEIGQLIALDHLFLQRNDLEGQMPNEVCDLRLNNNLTLLWSDCNGFPPRVECKKTCCTTCFSNPRNGDDSSEVESPTTHADEGRIILEKLKRKAPDGGASLDDDSSPQYKAYTWLAGSDYSSLTDIFLLQRYALVTLYFSTAGAGWKRNDFWLSDKSECPSNDDAHWYGVDRCDSGGLVTHIKISSNNMVGTLPPELSHFRMLEVVDFSDNDLYGNLPTQFGQFQELEVLQLSGNELTGSVSDDLGFILTLQELYLHKNDFTGSIPDSICDLKAPIGVLDVVWADCSGNPPSVTCQEFCCTECFSDSSEYIVQAESEVDTYIPTLMPATSSQTQSPTVSENPELKSFLLEHMDGFEDSLSDSNLPAYKAYLWLANADNYDDLDPFNILQRFGLVSFYLSTTPDFDWKVSTGWQTKQHECSWYGVTCSDNNTISEISLPNNRLSGTLPRDLALVGVGGKIVYMDLSGNNIGGKIVSELGTLKNLAFLDLKANDFTGSIPSELGHLSKLGSLQLHANELTGNMPEEICSLRSGGLKLLVADCDFENEVDGVTCAENTCCTSCY